MLLANWLFTCLSPSCIGLHFGSLNFSDYNYLRDMKVMLHSLTLLSIADFLRILWFPSETTRPMRGGPYWTFRENSLVIATGFSVIDKDTYVFPYLLAHLLTYFSTY